MHSLVFLQEHSNELDNKKASTYGNKATVTVEPLDGINIYLRAVAKLLELTETIVQDINKLTGRNTDTEIKLKAKIAEDYLKFKSICEEFLKGFSVVHDESIKDAAFLIYRTFSFLLTQIDIIFISKKVEHANQIKHYLEKLETLFNQMRDILSTGNEVNSSQESKNEISTVNNDI